MDFEHLIAPLSRDEFMKRFRESVCFVIRGDENKFSDLITLQDIENRLNDGCNLNAPVNIILPEGNRRNFVHKDVSWSQMAVDKQEVLNRLASGQSFMMMNLSQINPKVAILLDTLEDALSESSLHGDLHLYVSTVGGASAYNAHRDFPQHKIYLQVIGRTEWRVFNHDPDMPSEVRALQEDDESKYLKEAAHFTLNPGDMFYMPPAVFHKVRNFTGPRVSFSIPLVPAGENRRMDRTYIPFKSLFESGLKSSRVA